MENILSLLGDEKTLRFLRALLIILPGFFLAKGGSKFFSLMLSKKLHKHETVQLRRVFFYAIFLLFFITALSELGFNLGVILGAAGVFSVAIGFAAQTSTSNLISGIFLLGERSFLVGDIIKVGETTGEVLSIDLLSVKLRTFDNLFVRIPNETLIKSEVTNITRFPIRRVDLQLGVAYKEEIEHVRKILLAVATNNPLCLEEPEPIFIFKGFGASSLDIQFSVWTAKDNFLAMRNSIQEEIKIAFDRAGIEIPFPHQTIYTGSITDPFPIRLVSEPEVAREVD